MAKLWDVARHEFLTTVKRRSYLLTLILVPLLPALLLGGVNLINRGDQNNLQEMIAREAANPLPMGVVDQSKLITSTPDWIMGKQLVMVEDEAAAKAETLDGKLKGYFIIPADYIQAGKVVMVREDTGIFASMNRGNAIDQLLDYNLLGADQDAYLRYTNPAQVISEPIYPETADTRDTNNMANFFLPYGVMMFFYFMILGSSSMMLEAITKDKENRVMEILLSSVTPLEIFLGKVIGLGGASILQMAVWFGAAAALLSLSGQTFAALSGVVIPWIAVVLAVPYFTLGFILYGSLMAGVGALAPNLREGNQSTFIISLPLIFTILAMAQLIQKPSGGLSLFMSLFPLTSPVAMPARLTMIAVPWWQILVSVALLALTAWLVVRGVAKLFHAQTLLTGQKFEIRKFLKALIAS